MSKLLLIIADILEKNLDGIITKSIGSLLEQEASKEILQVLLHKKTSLNLNYLSALKASYVTPSSAYGKPIATVYGTGKVDGRVIWSLPIRYTQHRAISTSGKSGRRKEKTSANCSVTLAIAICKGPVYQLSKMWANDAPVDLENLLYRLYQGTEDQEPDPKIIEHEKHAPAYRGLAYMVIEEFPLQNYNNTIPRFSFEVTAYTNKLLRNHITQKILEIHTVGQGEWAYDTNIQTRIPIAVINGKEIPLGEAKKINGRGKSSYAAQGLAQLRSTLPNIQWVAVSVHWFASASGIKNCSIKPGTVRNNDSIVASDSWKVGKYTADSAFEIPVESLDRLPGETPSDSSLQRYISKLKLMNYKVMLVLKIVVALDSDVKLDCDDNDVDSINRFFIEQYRPFVEHYCNLAKKTVDAFVIASGLSKLTKIQDKHSKTFPAVDALINVAVYAKTSLGKNVVITYAADHDEYHSHNGIYNMDPLWSSSSIDVVGINAYFPLCSPSQPICGFSANNVADLWKSGGQENLDSFSIYNKDPRFSWRDIGHWWRKYHTIGDSNKTTLWKPGAKKIWFIEYGFPSTAYSLTGKTPHMGENTSTNTEADYTAQKTAISGTILAWKSSIMVKKMFLYAWSITPYNKNPKTLKSWQTSYIINSKISTITLSSILHDILRDTPVKLKVLEADLEGSIHGFVITNPQSTWEIVKELQRIYLFCIGEDVNSITLSNEPANAPLVIPLEDILQQEYTVTSTMQKPQQNLSLLYRNLHFDYQLRLMEHPSNQHHSANVTVIPTSLVLDDQQAAKIITSMKKFLCRPMCIYEMLLPLRYLKLKVGDIIQIKDALVAVTNIKIQSEHVFLRGNTFFPSTQQILTPLKHITN